MGRRFVPQSTIARRVQAKDDRMNAAIEAFRRRTGGDPPTDDVVPVVVDVAIEPVPEAEGPVVDVTLVPKNADGGR